MCNVTFSTLLILSCFRCKHLRCEVCTAFLTALRLALSFKFTNHKTMITILHLHHLRLIMTIFVTIFWQFVRVCIVLLFWRELKVNFQVLSIADVLYACQTLIDRLNSTRFHLDCIHLTGKDCLFQSTSLLSSSFCLAIWPLLIFGF